MYYRYFLQHHGQRPPQSAFKATIEVNIGHMVHISDLHDNAEAFFNHFASPVSPPFSLCAAAAVLMGSPQYRPPLPSVHPHCPISPKSFLPFISSQTSSYLLSLLLLFFINTK